MGSNQDYLSKKWDALYEIDTDALTQLLQYTHLLTSAFIV